MAKRPFLATAALSPIELTIYCQVLLLIFVLALCLCHHQVKAETDDLVLDLWHMPLSSMEVGENFCRMNCIRVISKTFMRDPLEDERHSS